jgi:predicted FMN-binding regulatory protein PaiB
MASDNIVYDYFVERIENVSFANGVFRISLGTQEENDTRTAVRLMIPANQISSILQGMASAARNIDQKVQAKMGQNAAKTDASNVKKAKSAKRAPKKNKK